MKLYQNIMEDLVEDALDAMVGQIEFCNCEMCRADIVALALNHLPPKYAVSPCGIGYSKVMSLQYQHQADIQQALIKAILLVNEHPRHDPEALEALKKRMASKQ